MWPFTDAYPERSLADIDGKTFDYIVVGGGTAGCVVASRLSEDPDVSVLLIEKGPIKDSFLSRIPLLSQNYAFSWSTGVTDRFSEPIAAYNGRRLQLPNGEGLGGTTRVNGTMLTRGPPGGYNEWADDLGLAGWGWADVEPYFRKMEAALDRPADYRGHEGPMVNRRPGLVYEFYSFITKACAALGLPVEEDCNAPAASAQGLFGVDSAVYPDGTRVSAYRAYLCKRLALARRDRLTICTEALATKLQLDERGEKVTGVYVTSAAAASAAGKEGKEGKKRGGAPPPVLALARREVVVCGGAFRSPQLLMLSGLGPRAHLASAGVACVRDLPAVGRHLADHFAVPLMIELPAHDTAHRLVLGGPLFGVRSLLQHVVFGTGLLSFPTNAATIFARTSALDEATYTVRKTEAGDGADGADTMDASLPRNVPDVEIMLNPVNSINLDLPGRTARKRAFLTLYTTLVQACTEGGRLELADAADPAAHLRVVYPTLDDAGDAAWAVMRKAVRLALRLADEFIERSGYPHPAVLRFAPGMDMAELRRVMQGRVGERPSPPEEAARTDADGPDLTLAPVDRTWATVTDDEIDAYAREASQSSLHYACTCRMANDAQQGVVDARLRVHGLANLRIADASVFPKIPSAHTMAPALMVGERCADFIKADWADRQAGS